MIRDPRIRPLEDPTPLTPRVDVIDTVGLPDYAHNAEEYWQIVERIWPAILDIFDRVNMSDRYAELEDMRKKKDKAISSLFNTAWIAAPDAYFIHTWPQWSRFCDLCSECGVLYEDEE